MVFRKAIEAIAGTVKGIEFRHWEEFAGFCANSPIGGILDLPNNVSVVKRGKGVVFFTRQNNI